MGCIASQQLVTMYFWIPSFVSDIVGIYYLNNNAVSRDSKLQAWVREIFQKCFLSCVSSGKVSIPVFHPLDPTSPRQQPLGFQHHALHPTLI